MSNAASNWQPDPDQLRSIHAASAETVKETPVFSLGELSRRCGRAVVVKAENIQRTGSFKLRGSLAKLAGKDAGNCRGVVAGSAGNHGQALAYAARARGIPCTVFMPEDAAISKVDAVAAFGARVVLEGSAIDECLEAAHRLAEEDGLLFVHPFDDLDVIGGQAGVGLELREQVPELAKVIVPVGGGGLISGIAAALEATGGGVEVAGVQAAGCFAFETSLEGGEPLAVAARSTIADGIAVKRPGELTLELVRRWVEEVAAVDDDAIAEAMVFLVEYAKLVTEGAGAVGVAALLTGALRPAASGTTAVVLSGGNVDAHVLAEVINRHQTGIGRRTRLFSKISDRPGGLVDFLQIIARGGGNVLDVTHVRDGVSLHVKETGVEVLVESRSERHGDELLARLAESGYEVEELGPR
jgi:threonine dehydratase